MGLKLSDEALGYFREMGAKGGRIGGKKRLVTMTPAQRSAIARKAATVRWGNRKAGSKTPQKPPTSLPGAKQGKGNGQAWAAEQNRQGQARLRIIQAMERLAIAHDKWPEFVQAYYLKPSERIEYRQRLSPPSFQPPAFDRLHQSAKAWMKDADAAWQQYRTHFLERCEMWAKAAVDEEIVQPKATRSTGRFPAGSRKRGSNTPLNRRYEWAAKCLVGFSLKEIAAQEGADSSTVGRVARSVLRMARWEEQ